jgi:hypothetical protein
MCFNFAFILVIYFTFVETNSYLLEKLDAIFEEAYNKGENPVFTERRVRKEGFAPMLRRGGVREEVGRGPGVGVGVEGR